MSADPRAELDALIKQNAGPAPAAPAAPAPAAAPTAPAVDPKTQSALSDILKSSLIFGGGGLVAAAIIRSIKRRNDKAKREGLLRAATEADSPEVSASVAGEMGEATPWGKTAAAGAPSWSAVGRDPNKVVSNTTASDRDTQTTIPGALVKGALDISVDLAAEGAKQTTLMVPGGGAMFRFLTDPDAPAWKGPAAIAAGLATLYGGYKGMDWLMSKIDKDEDEAAYDLARTRYQHKVREALRKRYGDLQKTSSILSEASRVSGIPFKGLLLPDSELASLKAAAEKEAALEKQAQLADKDKPMDPKRQYLAGMALLGMAGLGGLSYVAAKRYFDRNSEGRQRYKQLEREIRQRYLDEQAPVQVSADFAFLDPKGEDIVDKLKKRKAAAVRTVAPTAGATGPVAVPDVVEAPHEELLTRELAAENKAEDTTPVLA